VTVPRRWPSSSRRSVWISGSATEVSRGFVRNDPKPIWRLRTLAGSPWTTSSVTALDVPAVRDRAIAVDRGGQQRATRHVSW